MGPSEENLLLSPAEILLLLLLFLSRVRFGAASTEKRRRFSWASFVPRLEDRRCCRESEVTRVTPIYVKILGTFHASERLNESRTVDYVRLL